MGVLKPQFKLLDATGQTSSTNGPAVNPQPLQDEVVELDCTEDVAGTSFDAKVVDSFDGGVTWNDWVTFAQLATTGREIKIPTRPHGGTLRVETTIVGGTWSPRVTLAGVRAK